jgi:hypothetical protein
MFAPSYKNDSIICPSYVSTRDLLFQDLQKHEFALLAFERPKKIVVSLVTE